MAMRIGIIGCGNMGEAIISGNIESRSVSPGDFIVFEQKKARQASLGRKYFVKAGRDISGLLRHCDVVIIAVKPQDIDVVLEELRRATAVSGKKVLLVSIVAGVTTDYIQRMTGARTRVVRAMPNMALKIAKGITALTKGRYASLQDLKAARKIFEPLGEVVEIANEDLIDVVTAVSGSGPAYFFYIFRAILHVAEELGLSNKVATKLICQTALGSIMLLAREDFDAQGLIGKVASKGGTTEAALKVFSDKGLEKTIRSAVIAAYKRSSELSR